MPHTFTFETDLLRGPQEREIEVTVTYIVTDRVPATYWQPAEGGEVEVVSVKHGGAELHTTREEDNVLQDLACDRADQDIAEWLADFGEHRADMRREARWGEAA